jgi:aminoglycoside phosphotransferase (APT) family kinase protein
MNNENYTEEIIDEESIAVYIEENLGSVQSYNFELLEAGHSNETIFVDWGDLELVLRCPPPGETAGTAHDVLREYQIMEALQETEVRVPETILACKDRSVLGREFYLMERERGDIIRDEEPERFDSQQYREQIGKELVNRLTEVHDVDYNAAGLSDFGEPSTYLERQVERWQSQFDWACQVTAQERELSSIGTVGEWLEENIPAEHPHAVVHGDYKTDNVVFDSGVPPNVIGILDWELSTLGDPRTDLGWLLLFWRGKADPEPTVPELIPTFTQKEGYWSRKELVKWYEKQSDVEFKRKRFYYVLAMYKLGAICEMFFRRHIEGNSNNPVYPKMRQRVPDLMERAVEKTNGMLGF